MQIGYFGLGKMGKNMVLRLLEHDVDVVAWNRSAEPREEVETAGATTFENPVDVIKSLSTPRVIWLMLPAGEVTQTMIDALIPYLDRGDVIIDGGNAFYRDSVDRASLVGKLGIRYMDVGVSGGPSGARSGACLMVGGDRNDFDELTPLLKIIAAPDAFGYFGKHGAGHFTKMVHNGIEYGMMQAIAEGAAVLRASEFDIDLAEAFRVYNNRSVIESRLVEWTQEALAEDSELSHISSQINHSGEGEWTIKTAKDLGVDVPVIEKSFEVRVHSSAKSNSFRDKVVSAMRGKFGGHPVSND